MVLKRQDLDDFESGPVLPLGELDNCLRPPSPKILEKNRVVSNELQK